MKVVNIWKQEYFKNRDIYVLLFKSTLVWGIIAHGYIMFNKITLHDESLEMFGQDFSTINQGRWMQEVIRRVEIILFSYNRLSTTYLYALYAFVVCFFLTCIIYRYYGIVGKERLIVLSGVIVTSPTIMMCFGYSYFLPYYLTGFLFMIVSIYFAAQKKKGITLIWSVIFLCLAMGVYQSWMTFGMSLIFLLYYNEVEKKEYKFKDFIINGLYYLCIPVFSSALYFIINSIVLRITKIQMTSYAGLDSMGLTDMNGYIDRIRKAYMWFASPNALERNIYFPLTSIYLYKILLVLVIVHLFIQYICLCKLGRKNIFQLIVLLIFFPIVIFAMLVLCGVDYLSPLNLMSYITLIIFFLQRSDDKISLTFSRNGRVEYFVCKTIRCLGRTILLLILVLDVFYVRFDNSNYLKAEIVQNKMREWFSRLACNVQNTEGYDDELPLLYINEEGKRDLTLKVNPSYNMTIIWPYALNEDYLLNDFAWRAFMQNQSGFAPRLIGWDDPLVKDEDRQYFETMPSYPDDGSIKHMGNYIVVKF